MASSMFAGYNKHNNCTIRLGNWQEEQALKELTGLSRTGDPRQKAVLDVSGPRVLYHSAQEHAKDYKSTVLATYVNPAQVAEYKDRSKHMRLGPAALRQQKAIQEILAQEEAERKAAAQAQEEVHHLSSTTRSSYKGFTPAQMQMATRRKVAAGEGACTAEAPPQGGQKYNTNAAVTVWTTLSTDKGQRGSFGRSFHITSAEEAPQVHANHVYDEAMPPGLSEIDILTLGRIRKRVAETGFRRPLPSIRSLLSLPWSRDSADGSLGMQPLDFRKAMSAMSMPLNEAEAACCMVSFSETGRGRICLDRFYYTMRGTMSESREQLVCQVFEQLCGDCSSEVPVDSVADAYDYEEHAKALGRCSDPAAVREELVRHFGGKPCVTLDNFVDLYRDVSAAISEDQLFVSLLRNAWHC